MVFCMHKTSQFAKIAHWVICCILQYNAPNLTFNSQCDENELELISVVIFSPCLDSLFKRFSFLHKNEKMKMQKDPVKHF